MDQSFSASKYPSNSKNVPRAKDEPKKVERVVQGEVVRRKTPLGRRMSQNLLGGDAQSVWGYVFGEVLIPAARDMIADAVSGGVERMIFGDSASPSRRSRSRGGSNRYQTDYNSVTRGRSYREEPRREVSRKSRSNHDFDEIVLETRVEAEEVLDRMEDMIDKYDHVSVADFYELCGVSSNYTDNKWGWFQLNGANVSRTRGGGYLVSLPRPEIID